ncbi:MAG: hypothetical protein WDA16_14290 [Candidatus Thermoplasmatota archaeon]
MQNEPFGKRFESAITEFVILEKAKQGEVTRDSLKNTLRGNLQTSTDFDTTIRQLVSDGHLNENGNKYTISDDCREDIQKAERLVPEIQQFIHASGSGQQGRSTQPSTPGMSGRSGQSGSSSTQGGSSTSNPKTSSTQNPESNKDWQKKDY